MMHTSRRMSVATLATAEEFLATFRRCSTWCPCNGFRVGDDYLFLNDSFGPDSAQEYAVAKIEPDGRVRQLDSATVSWMGQEEFAAYVHSVLAGELDGYTFGGYLSNRIETPEQHGRCDHCA